MGVMRATPQSPRALATCGVPRGQITFGVPINSAFGDCFIANTYIDFWVFTAQAGQQVRVTFSSTPSVLVTIQDFTTGAILADSKASCGGGLCTSGSFTYTPLSSVQYLVGLGSLSSGGYTFTVDSGGGPPPGGANLTPCKPSGWSDKIVISKVTGDHIDAASFSTTDTLYVDYAVCNFGTASTGMGFQNQLFLDGVLIRTGNASTVDVNFFTFGSDVVIGPLTAGGHTLRLKADSANVIAETDESDNEYTRTFTVGAVVAPCVSGAATLCLGIFKISVAWQTTTAAGTGVAIPLTSDTGAFWFFNSGNIEVVIKVLDGRPVNGRFWVFAGGLTDVNVVITVTNTQTGAVKTYTNPRGTAFQPIQDTSAFPG